ncbi:hypothetical protein NPIL_233951 [Nephila pilipes]|uniref:Uncharacterized protein n=1 Tax=Nephila pilipes TaxID=299642 RepID=A0A8X6PY07_NEPPI|nr:hypothetical protein NPIL_233951 [Nephila pilipes]
MLGYHKIRSAAYQPQKNGIIERFIVLSKMLSEHKTKLNGPKFFPLYFSVCAHRPRRTLRLPVHNLLLEPLYDYPPILWQVVGLTKPSTPPMSLI